MTENMTSRYMMLRNTLEDKMKLNEKDMPQGKQLNSNARGPWRKPWQK